MLLLSPAIEQNIRTRDYLISSAIHVLHVFHLLFRDVTASGLLYMNSNTFRGGLR